MLSLYISTLFLHVAQIYVIIIVTNGKLVLIDKGIEMYLIRQKFSDEFEVAKFDERDQPEAVYKIKKGKCSCPSSYRTKRCKHINLLESFKAQKEGIYWYEFNRNKEVLKHRIEVFDV